MRPPEREALLLVLEVMKDSIFHDMTNGSEWLYEDGDPDPATIKRREKMIMRMVGELNRRIYRLRHGQAAVEAAFGRKRRR